jgi:tetratricopeptide (TPR) repeat protein
LVAETGLAARSWLESLPGYGVFDETDYFLGETALVAATGYRLLGQLDRAESLLDIAEDSFRHTVNPAPLIAKVQFQRLALRYDLHRFQSVLESIGSLRTSFQRLGMLGDAAKAAFLEAMATKQSGQTDRAFSLFTELRGSLSDNSNGVLAGCLVEIGAYHGENQEYDRALQAYDEAADLIALSNQPARMAHLKATIGETYRAKGELNAAVNSFRLAIQHYSSLEMSSMVAYLRVLTAELLLTANREREAEWEIRAALPIIDESRLMAEGLAAMGLLKECLRRRKLDGDVVGRVKGHLSQN